MPWLNPCTEDTGLGSGRHQSVISIKPRAYWRDVPGGGQVLTANDREITWDGAMWRARGPLQARFADTLKVGQAVKEIAAGGVSLSVAPTVAKDVAGGFVLDDTGKRIGRIYPGAWPGADYQVTWIGHQVKESIILGKGYPQSIDLVQTMPGGVLVANAKAEITHIANAKGQPCLIARGAYLHNPKDPMGPTVPVKQIVVSDGGQTIIRLVLPDGDWTGWVLDPTWTSQPGAAEGKDATLDGQWPTYNLGGSTLMFVVHTRAKLPMLEFDLTSIPASSRVITGTLTLRFSLDSGTRGITVNAYRGLTAWVEGTKNWEAPADGVTYNTYDGANTWPGGYGGGANVDYVSPAETSITVDPDGSYDFSIPSMVGDWVANP